MLIGLRDKKDKLRIKDILDINMDMHVVQDGDQFRVRISNLYFLDEMYISEKDAESAMYNLANIRNEIESQMIG